MKKKLICLILAALMVLSIMPVSTFAVSETAIQCADVLYNLGLFSGTGKNADGTPIYALDKAPTRAEAITMLVRLLGKDAEAKSKAWDIPFDDVDDWAKPYVGYAYNNGLTSGVSATKFDSNTKASEAQYITFILRALGYSDANGDFAWNSSKTLSNKLKITQGTTNKNFLRADVVEISYFALNTLIKDSKDRLIDVLYANHAVSTTDMATVERTQNNNDPTKKYLPSGSFDGISYKDLARACGLNEDLYYITNPTTEADHINNVKYIVLTGQYSFKKSNNSSIAATNWGNCKRTIAGKMSTLSRLYGQLLGVFSNYWCEFYYENGAYTLYCSIDSVLSPKDIQTYLAEAYKIIDAKHNEFVKSGKLSAKSSDYEKAKVYAEWLTNFAREKTTQPSIPFPEGAVIQTPYSFLAHNEANCVGRASTVAMAWNYAGIKAYTAVCGHVPGNWEGHLLPWAIIDGKEYTVETFDKGAKKSFCEVMSDGSAAQANAYLSPYFIAAAKKEMGVSYDKAYDMTDPNLLNKVAKCQAEVQDIPFTVEYIKTNEAGEEVYFVKIDSSYTESTEKEYQVYLTTNRGNGMGTISNFYKLDKMKTGINVRIPKEGRIEKLILSMDKIMIQTR